MKKIIIAGEKGGTGKSTLAAFLAEYLNFQQQTVQVVDLDPLQITAHYVLNCQSEGRMVSTKLNPAYQIIDTAGITGASSSYVKTADLLIIPFRAHYNDLLVVKPWFAKLSYATQQKVCFLPNFWRNTKEQREGLREINDLVLSKAAGFILPALADKPARYGTITNGFPRNFFTTSQDQELLTIFEIILTKLK